MTERLLASRSVATFGKKEPRDERPESLMAPLGDTGDLPVVVFKGPRDNLDLAVGSKSLWYL